MSKTEKCGAIFYSEAECELWLRRQVEQLGRRARWEQRQRMMRPLCFPAQQQPPGSHSGTLFTEHHFVEQPSHKFHAWGGIWRCKILSFHLNLFRAVSVNASIRMWLKSEFNVLFFKMALNHVSLCPFYSLMIPVGTSLEHHMCPAVLFYPLHDTITHHECFTNGSSCLWQLWFLGFYHGWVGGVDLSSLFQLCLLFILQ